MNAKDAATIKHVSVSPVGHIGESLHSSEIDGIRWKDVTNEFLNRNIPFFVKKTNVEREQ